MVERISFLIDCSVHDLAVGYAIDALHRLMQCSERRLLKHVYILCSGFKQALTNYLVLRRSMLKYISMLLRRFDRFSPRGRRTVAVAKRLRKGGGGARLTDEAPETEVPTSRGPGRGRKRPRGKDPRRAPLDDEGTPNK